VRVGRAGHKRRRLWWRPLPLQRRHEVFPTLGREGDKGQRKEAPTESAAAPVVFSPLGLQRITTLKRTLGRREPS